MKKSRFSHITPMHWLAILLVAAMVSACASIGRPDGGPRDETPPVFVSSSPAPGALNVSAQQIDLYFDENVQLEDAFNKVIVSPAQKNNPRVSSNGKHVRVLLQDSLIPNTTYTIDFADAIKDLNEGNIIDGFSTYFSTGDTIDTLSISGMVLEARTLEPAQGMLVGVYSNLSDTAITTLPLERIARTNQYGQFSVLNLKPGDYRIYAVNDLNRDFHWDRSEDVAFYDVTLSPWVEEIVVTDTLRSSLNQDSLVSRQGHAYYPNDVLLTWFNEGYAASYLKDYTRKERRKFNINLSAPVDSLPQITVAGGKYDGLAAEDFTVMRHNATLDSLEYWFTDTAVMAVDSLYLSVRYQATDTTDMLAWKTDTLKFFFKEPVTKENKKKKKEDEEEADTLPEPVKFMSFKPVASGRQEVYAPLMFQADQPIDSINPSGVRLEIAVDTIWEQVRGITLLTDSVNHLQNRYINHSWQPGAKYRVTVDSAAVTGIYGEWNDRVSQEFEVKTLEEYSNLTFSVAGLDTLAAYIEILDNSDNPTRVVPVKNGNAEARYMQPGTVYARLFIDRNGNGKWDTGIIDSIQPEDVFYYNKKINLKKNWDVNIDWDIYAVAVDKQKPSDIKKNKPKRKKGEKDSQSSEDEEENDFGNSFMFDDTTPYSNSRRNSSY